MCVLIGTTVKTQYADYPCATREEAETLFMTLRAREAAPMRDRVRAPEAGRGRREARAQKV